MSSAEAALDRNLSARNFSTAATRYDGCADLQRRVAEDLITHLASPPSPKSTVLDLGSGTGCCARLLRSRFDVRNILALDRAAGMSRISKLAQIDWSVTGDALRLPVRASSIDLIVSSMALQWVQPLNQALAECRRVLKPHGTIGFSIPCDGTLEELRQAWKAVDSHEHVHRFSTPSELLDQVQRSGLILLSWRQVAYQIPHATVFDLMRSLKGTGATNVHRQRRRGFVPRNAIARLEQAYHSPYSDHGIKASWVICHVQATTRAPADQQASSSD